MRLNSGQLERLVVEHRAALRLLAATICNSPDDAVQQAFVKLAAMSPAPDNPPAWLYRVVKNNSISQLRSESRRKRREKAAGTESILRRQLFESEEADADSQKLACALRQLAHDTRQIVVAKIWGNLTFEEIAKEADCSSSTAHRRYRDALKEMKDLLNLPVSESGKAGFVENES